jgi:hypothetical protein
MANIEAAIVVHLRSLYYAQSPLDIFPLNLMTHRDLTIELSREACTIIMITAVAMLTEKNAMRRFAAFVMVFGLWDIFYYAWLKIMIGWPVSWHEWDVLFLIPWPWFGPWIAPALIALLFTLWGAWIILSKNSHRFSRVTMVIFITGAGAGLTSFLLPGFGLLPGGEEAFRGYQPGTFHWMIFIIGLVMMSYALLKIILDANKPGTEM